MPKQKANSKMKGILWLSTVDQSSPVTPKFPNLARHFHVTLQFGIDWEALFPEVKALIGNQYTVSIMANCHNDRIQALSVTLPEEVAHLCNNLNPHITVSMANGVKPVESNQMLASEHFYSLISPQEPNKVITTLQFHQFT
jgi:hypothetical protein